MTGEKWEKARNSEARTRAKRRRETARSVREMKRRTVEVTIADRLEFRRRRWSGRGTTRSG
jgi:hypothetical protein